MKRDTTLDQSGDLIDKEDLILPSFTERLESVLSRGKSLQVKGTNVVRVPFGIRQPRRQRPARPERLATLVLPFQPLGSPTPPPQAA